MLYLKDKFLFTIQSYLDMLCLYGKIGRGELYFLKDTKEIAVGLNNFSYGVIPFTYEYLIHDINYRGYFIGGWNGLMSLDTIDVMYFNTETIDVLIEKIKNAKTGHCGISSEEKGYWYGGYDENGNSFQDIEILKFNNHNIDVLISNLTTIRHNLSGLMSNVKGYWCGGYSGNSLLQTIDYIYFYNETLLSSLSLLDKNNCFYSTISLKEQGNGYLFGGCNVENNVNFLNDINKFIFITETFLFSINSLLYNRADSTCIYTDHHNNGYIIGGYGYMKLLDTIERFTYITETIDAINEILTVPRLSLESISSKEKGYWGGGYDEECHSGGIYNNIDAFVFNTESILSSFSTLSSVRDNFTSISYVE